MSELTVESYVANIPECCLYQTLEEHESIMLCWGLAQSIKKKETMNCGYCELNTDVTAAQRREHYAKLKTFNILKDAETR